MEGFAILLVLLACPLAMWLMMRSMHGGMSADKRNEGPEEAT